jgi:hypothetical protein
MARKCSVCKQEGHTKTKCPNKVEGERILFKPVKNIANREPKTNSKSTEERVDCSICWKTLGKTGRVVTNCGHPFCMDCMMKHTHSNIESNNKCPMCRRELFKKKDKYNFTIQMDGADVNLADHLSARDYEYFIDLMDTIPEGNVHEQAIVIEHVIQHANVNAA